MTENERKLWKAVDQINGQIEVARTYYYDYGLCDEQCLIYPEKAQFEEALSELIRYGAIARLRLREILRER